jgi:23S rRNA G2069 N7-methylase RlmK/C1962 C5-methylase RlmI
VSAHESRNSPEKIAAQGELLFNRLSRRYRHLKKWARRIGTNAFRLYDRDIPEIPLLLDFYGDAVSGAFFRTSQKKGVPDSEPIETWLSAMKAAAARALDIPEDRIFLKERRQMKNRQNTGTQYNRMQKVNFYRDVIEGDLRFRVNLSDYLDTGLFLDARKKRALIRGKAAGKRVLNLFAYTCSLSVSAAKGGAARVDSVDLSTTYLEWGRINFALNGLQDSNDFPLIKSDVFQFLSKAAAHWDLIILDPPGFSNSKKVKGSLDLKRDHIDLIRLCLSRLSPGGTLWFSSNAKGLSLESGDWPGYALKDMRPSLTDEDFRGKRIPACYKLSLCYN